MYSNNARKETNMLDAYRILSVDTLLYLLGVWLTKYKRKALMRES